MCKMDFIEEIMEGFGKASWGSMRIYGDLWGSMDIYGDYNYYVNHVSNYDSVYYMIPANLMDIYIYIWIYIYGTYMGIMIQ